MYEQASGARLDDLWKQYRFLQAQPEPPKTGLIDRLLGRAPEKAAGEKAEKELAQLHAVLVEAQRTWDKARAGVALAERNHKAAQSSHRAQITDAVNKANIVLHQVRFARRLMGVYPRLAYCGPSFVHWTARKALGTIRRYHLHPQTRNIWGLPLEP